MRNLLMVSLLLLLVIVLDGCGKESANYSFAISCNVGNRTDNVRNQVVCQTSLYQYFDGVSYSTKYLSVEKGWISLGDGTYPANALNPDPAPSDCTFTITSGQLVSATYQNITHTCN